MHLLIQPVYFRTHLSSSIFSPPHTDLLLNVSFLLMPSALLRRYIETTSSWKPRLNPFSRNNQSFNPNKCNFFKKKKMTKNQKIREMEGQNANCGCTEHATALTTITATNQSITVSSTHIPVCTEIAPANPLVHWGYYKAKILRPGLCIYTCNLLCSAADLT